MSNLNNQLKDLVNGVTTDDQLQGSENELTSQDQIENEQDQIGTDAPTDSNASTDLDELDTGTDSDDGSDGDSEDDTDSSSDSSQDSDSDESTDEDSGQEDSDDSEEDSASSQDADSGEEDSDDSEEDDSEDESSDSDSNEGEEDDDEDSDEELDFEDDEGSEEDDSQVTGNDDDSDDDDSAVLDSGDDDDNDGDVSNDDTGLIDIEGDDEGSDSDDVDTSDDNDADTDNDGDGSASSSDDSDQADSEDETFDIDGNLTDSEDGGEDKTEVLASEGSSGLTNSEIERARVTIEEAEAISDRLGRIATMVADKYPEAVEAGRNDPNFKVFRETIGIALESIQLQAKEVIGEEADIEKHDPLIQGTTKALGMVNDTLTESLADDAQDLQTLLVDVSKAYSESGATISAGTTTSPDLYKVLNVEGSFNPQRFVVAPILLRIATGIKNWVKTEYIDTYLTDTLNGEQVRVPQAPQLPELIDTSSSLITEVSARFNIHRQAVSTLLPGNYILGYYKPLEQELVGNRDGSVKLMYLEPKVRLPEAGTIPVPNQAVVGILKSELASIIDTVAVLRSTMTELQRLTTNLSTWVADGEPEDVSLIAVNTLLLVVEPITHLNSYCLRYARALAQYAQLSAS